MIAGMGYTQQCCCGAQYRMACSSYDHESWCPQHPNNAGTKVVYVTATNDGCAHCRKLERELAQERGARKDAERRLLFYKQKRKR